MIDPKREGNVQSLISNFIWTCISDTFYQYRDIRDERTRDDRSRVDDRSYSRRIDDRRNDDRRNDVRREKDHHSSGSSRSGRRH